MSTFKSKLAGNLAVAAMLVGGIGFGAVAAMFTSKPPLTPDARPDPAIFQVAASNTPGFPEIKSGDYDLVDHHGNRRTSKSPEGTFQLLFFGYSNCKAICSVALPNLAEAVDIMEGMNAPVTPVLITVDHERDTVAALNDAVGDIHPKLVGLTGTPQNLDAAYKAFNLEKKFLFEHVDEGAVYSHGGDAVQSLAFRRGAQGSQTVCKKRS